jgi:subtilisin family serine protease
MRLTALGQAALAAILVAGLGVAAAQTTGATRFKQVDDVVKKIDTSRLLSARFERPVRMLVVLSEPSVADARAASASHSITSTERASVVQRVRSQHDAMRGSLEGRGAKVLKQYHGAVNGMKVDVKPSQIESLKALPGVLKVLPVPVHTRDNAMTVPYIGAPAVWQGVNGLRGEHIKVAIIDTGIDYTHANFGGPGTTAAFTAAAAASTGPADPSLFGPNAPKVKGGIDLVGDAYDANVVGSVPVPDSNPLDCAAAGHGSHVAGTVAGFGVTSAGATYQGAYNPAIYTPNAFSIGPGVAPKADLYAVRVFGCAGSTDVVVDAIDWAINNDMDVINMSLGSSFGTADTADSLAAQAAAAAGVIVVASAGNAGPAPYITGAPAAGDGVISVAAVDGRPSFPGAVLTLASGATINAQDSNGAPLPAAPLSTVVLRNADGTVSLGCSAAEYAGTAGKLVVTLRGTCPRVDRATFGQQAGAAAVAMINNGAGYGIYEGPITGVSIPFLGIQPSDAAALTGAASASMVATTLNNNFAGTAASFSSGGPRTGDSALKPSLAAPGVSVFSTLVASGNGFEALSGTSMAAPHVAGVAALVTQAHPGWSQRQLAAAIAQTAVPSKLPDYSARIEGSGLVQPLAATKTNAVVSVSGDPNATAISFGFAEFSKDFKDTRELRISNLGHQRARFNIASRATGGDLHSVSLNKTSVSVSPGETETVKVSLFVPGASAGDSSAFNEVAGLVTLTPASAADNNGVSLNLPYYLVDRARSKLQANIAGDLGPRKPTATVRLSNDKSAAKPAVADFYAWGLAGTRQGAAPFDVRAVGVQSFPISATANLLVFAVNTFDRFNSAANAEVDIYMDVDGDGYADYVAYSYDYGAVTAGSFNGQAAVVVVNLKTGAAVLRYLTDAPTDGSTLLMPVRSSDIGLSAANPRVTYWAYSYSPTGGYNAVPGAAKFNAFSPAISNGDGAEVQPGATVSVPVTINPAEWAISPARGVMVVNKEGNAGAAQAALLGVR